MKEVRREANTRFFQLFQLLFHSGKRKGKESEREEGRSSRVDLEGETFSGRDREEDRKAAKKKRVGV